MPEGWKVKRLRMVIWILIILTSLNLGLKGTILNCKNVRDYTGVGVGGRAGLGVQVGLLTCTNPPPPHHPNQDK